VRPRSSLSGNLFYYFRSLSSPLFFIVPCLLRLLILSKVTEYDLDLGFGCIIWPDTLVWMDEEGLSDTFTSFTLHMIIWIGSLMHDLDCLCSFGNSLLKLKKFGILCSSIHCHIFLYCHAWSRMSVRLTALGRLLFTLFCPSPPISLQSSWPRIWSRVFIRAYLGCIW